MWVNVGKQKQLRSMQLTQRVKYCPVPSEYDIIYVQ